MLTAALSLAVALVAAPETSYPFLASPRLSANTSQTTLTQPRPYLIATAPLKPKLLSIVASCALIAYPGLLAAPRDSTRLTAKLARLVIAPVIFFT